MPIGCLCVYNVCVCLSVCLSVSVCLYTKWAMFKNIWSKPNTTDIFTLLPDWTSRFLCNFFLLVGSCHVDLFLQCYSSQNSLSDYTSNVFIIILIIHRFYKPKYADWSTFSTWRIYELMTYNRVLTEWGWTWDLHRNIKNECGWGSLQQKWHKWLPGVIVQTHSDKCSLKSQVALNCS